MNFISPTAISAGQCSPLFILRLQLRPGGPVCGVVSFGEAPFCGVWRYGDGGGIGGVIGFSFLVNYVTLSPPVQTLVEMFVECATHFLPRSVPPGELKLSRGNHLLPVPFRSFLQTKWLMHTIHFVAPSERPKRTIHANADIYVMLDNTVWCIAQLSRLYLPLRPHSVSAQNARELHSVYLKGH